MLLRKITNFCNISPLHIQQNRKEQKERKKIPLMNLELLLTCTWFWSLKRLYLGADLVATMQFLRRRAFPCILAGSSPAWRGCPGQWLHGLVAVLSIHVLCFHSPCLFEKLWSELDLLCISVLEDLFSFPFVLFSFSACLSIYVQLYRNNVLPPVPSINLRLICTASIYDKTLSFLSLLPFKFFCLVSKTVKFPYLHFRLGRYLGFQRRAGGVQTVGQRQSWALASCLMGQYC